MPTSVAEIASSQRDRILQAMASVCAVKGYQATTVGDIVRHARISRTTFYEHFRDKDQALREACGAALNELIAVASVTGSPDKPIPGTVDDALSAVLARIATKPLPAELGLVEGRFASPTREIYASAAQLASSMLDTARTIAPGEGRLPSSTARAAIGGAEALVRRELTAGRHECLRALLPDLVYVLLVAFLGQEKALEHSRLVRARQSGGKKRASTAVQPLTVQLQGHRLSRRARPGSRGTQASGPQPGTTQGGGDHGSIRP